ncbi:MAG: hypothetical protein L6Q59_08825 [Ignavibacteriaceae bacterium]|nr:hypothetical protein [Ignavibacteriaceae bacterium]
MVFTTFREKYVRLKIWQQFIRMREALKVKAAPVIATRDSINEQTFALSKF